MSLRATHVTTTTDTPKTFGILAELGFNAYRFSLEWSRIQPEQEYFSRAALDHYRRMIGTCLELGITPVVTYNHFTMPRWMLLDAVDGAMRMLRPTLLATPPRH